jgi:hypothetical protein
MRRDTKCDDFTFLATLLEFDGVMTFVAIEDQKTIAIVRSLGCTLVEML